MSDIVQLLQKLGFGEYEARAYVSLVQRSPLTGYELAKVSGIPRANVYAVLPRLEERGAVLRIDSPAGARYSAVPPEELAKRLANRFEDDLTAAKGALEALNIPIDKEHVWNAQGYMALVENARGLVDAAQSELLVALWPHEASALASSLAAAEARDVQITTLCLAGCVRECGGCQGNIYRHRVSEEQGGRWLVIVSDNAEMLAGDTGRPGEGITGDGDEALTVRTRQSLLVALAGWYVRNSIALSTVFSELGERLPGLLSPGAATTLATLSPGGLAGGWLEHMRQLLARSGTDPSAVSK
ncbi:MAG TPA: helix-turn-helix domain-containing protein [Chloroflexia bacterium]|jgi:DNA-binding MarR family transcriptional regulator